MSDIAPTGKWPKDWDYHILNAFRLYFCDKEIEFKASRPLTECNTDNPEVIEVYMIICILEYQKITFHVDISKTGDFFTINVYYFKEEETYIGYFVHISSETIVDYMCKNTPSAILEDIEEVILEHGEEDDDDDEGDKEEPLDPSPCSPSESKPVLC